jgi:D-glycero-D-manno-heptose 1,7-bisphosphate phosphatase
VLPSAKSAVFLDKDGTLVADTPYAADAGALQLLPDVPDGLRILAKAGFALVIVTNQSGVARGLVSLQSLAAARDRLAELFVDAGAVLSGFYYCPHHRDGVVAPYARECDCRKPQPGLLRRAAQELGLELSSSWMVGDLPSDVDAGQRAGCRTVLVHADNGPDFAAAARTIAQAAAAARSCEM